MVLKRQLLGSKHDVATSEAGDCGKEGKGAEGTAVEQVTPRESVIRTSNSSDNYRP